METNTPENVETVVTPAPDDQTGKPETTTAAPTLASIAGMHSEAHPGFDPAIHATAPDGSPKRKADGTYAMKRGRKAGSPLPPKYSGSGSTKEIDAATIEPQVARISADEAARQSANLLINGCVLLCGEQIGIPENKDEAQGLLFGFKNYYEARGVPNIPPEIGLIITVGMYVAPRIRKSESAKGKIARFVELVKSKIGG